jgi:hypothetical protein
MPRVPVTWVTAVTSNRRLVMVQTFTSAPPVIRVTVVTGNPDRVTRTLEGQICTPLQCIRPSEPSSTARGLVNLPARGCAEFYRETARRC